jgi:hypothetical protein
MICALKYKSHVQLPSYGADADISYVGLQGCRGRKDPRNEDAIEMVAATIGLVEAAIWVNAPITSIRAWCSNDPNQVVTLLRLAALLIQYRYHVHRSLVARPRCAYGNICIAYKPRYRYSRAS